MLEEKIQRNPQQGLRDQVCTNTCQQDGWKGFLTPEGISNDNCTLNANRDEEGKDQLFAERRTTKMVNPTTRPKPINAQRHATRIVPVRGKPPKLN